MGAPSLAGLPHEVSDYLRCDAEAILTAHLLNRGLSMVRLRQWHPAMLDRHLNAVLQAAEPAEWRDS